MDSPVPVPKHLLIDGNCTLLKCYCDLPPPFQGKRRWRPFFPFPITAASFFKKNLSRMISYEWNCIKNIFMIGNSNSIHPNYVIARWLSVNYVNERRYQWMTFTLLEQIPSLRASPTSWRIYRRTDNSLLRSFPVEEIKSEESVWSRREKWFFSFSIFGWVGSFSIPEYFPVDTESDVHRSWSPLYKWQDGVNITGWRYIQMDYIHWIFVKGVEVRTSWNSHWAIEARLMGAQILHLHLRPW